LPRRYQDRGSVVAASTALTTERPVLLRGTVVCTGSRRVRGRLSIGEGRFDDGSGTIPVRWFNQPWVAQRFENGVDAFVFGRVGTSRSGRRQLVNPEIRPLEEGLEPQDLVPIYSPVGPLAGKRLRNALDQALGVLADLADPLPQELRKDRGLPDLGSALTGLHRPSPERMDPGELAVQLNLRRTPAHRRLAFDELLAVACVVARHRAERLDRTAAPIRVRSTFPGEVTAFFPFEFTGAQRRVVGEILDDMAKPVPMARLLQGDVGSGKTAVATTAILAALAGGRQTALMAPTELLAEQLHRSVSATLGPTGIRVGLLTGAAQHAAAVRRRLDAGSLKVVVGTHALFQGKLRYDDLGLVVIDEQHRFGVAQRQRLVDKGPDPHLLVMTATPIPRSLALTLYGDLELSVIDEMPPGRRPVRTEIRDPSARSRIHAFLHSELSDGGQAFVVCPFIESSEEVAAPSIEETAVVLDRALDPYEVGVLHGRMSRNEQEAVASRFRSGELKVLLSTTVIEVGVDVPAATVMVVEGADRFGLSQLHQLRGRVGRGSRPSWCILVTGEQPSDDARRRLEVLAGTTDGFAVAEEDLRHRGPGELAGLRQWGADAFRFADLVRDQDLVRDTRSLARDLAATGELDRVRDRLLQLHPVGGAFGVG
jgi:ATP-dependent DNA helicase RecG